MGKEQPPIDLGLYREDKRKKETKGVEKISRKKFIEDAIVTAGDDRWIALSIIVNKMGGIIHPSRTDQYQAKQIKGMNDEDLIKHLKVTDRENWIAYPLSSKTLYNEIKRRMESEDPETSSG